MTQEKITEENLQHLLRKERSVNLYNDWVLGRKDEETIHDVMRRLTYKGVIKYSLQLVS